MPTPAPLLFLTDKAGNLRFVQRIEKLTPSSPARWGKMTVSQMLRHCLIPLELATGERRLPVHPVVSFFGPLIKPFLINQRIFGKNLPTPTDFVVKDAPDFREAQQALLQQVKKFDTGGRSLFIKTPHPFFGKMTAEDWDLLQTKHLDHHLRQFGV